MLRIITAPDTVLGYLDRVWPEHSRALSTGGLDFRRAVLVVTVQELVAAVSKARDLIADHTRTAARLVTAPEHVAVAESARVRSAAALLGLRLDAVLVNKVLPELSAPSDSPAPHRLETQDVAPWRGSRDAGGGREPQGARRAEHGATAHGHAAQASYGPRAVRGSAVNPTVALFGSEAPDPFAVSLAGGAPSPVPPPHPAVRWYSDRRAEQLAVVAELRERMRGVAVQVVGHAGAEPVGLEALRALSCAVDASGDWVGQRAVPMLGSDADGVLSTPGTGIAGPVVRLESGTGVHSVFAMRMHLPVVDPSTLQLGRVEDDLIVGADGVRRRLRLAPVLRRCTVDAAELDGDQLVIRFRTDPEVWPK
ncbi:ArsA family ATPase [Nocardia crassostreae]|uniref:ArsA family ATPase n=1 Tax=Nocardia crassostreae TaxID=53428 RepID=UPI00082D957A|nr:ArsA-related P-loop ATPase [Nocardia crassostreae]